MSYPWHLDSRVSTKIKESRNDLFEIKNSQEFIEDVSMKQEILEMLMT